VCWRTAAFAVGIDAVHGEAVPAPWQSANQGNSPHTKVPSRPWRVGCAHQEQGQPYSTLQLEYLPSPTGETLAVAQRPLPTAATVRAQLPPAPASFGRARLRSRAVPSPKMEATVACWAFERSSESVAWLWLNHDS
jgi:hypothetical protein